MTLSILGLFTTLSITKLDHYAECRVISVVLLSVIMLSVIMLSVIMLSVIMLSVIMLSVIMLNFIVLSVVLLSVVTPITFGCSVEDTEACTIKFLMVAIYSEAL